MTEGPSSPDAATLASVIDHTLLKPEATLDELARLCDEAVEHRFAAVCVNGANVAFVARRLDGSDVKPIAVVGFPLGAMLPRAKAFETRAVIQEGAQEVDTVINIGALKAGDHRATFEDLRAVVAAADDVPVKVIIEAVKLSRDEKLVACALAKASGAAFVKTSTGFGGGGATVQDVTLMRTAVGKQMGVKASGGIRDREAALVMLDAGADRLGTSASVTIVRGS